MQYVLQINPRGVGLVPPHIITGYIVTANWSITNPLFESMDSAAGEYLFIFREARDWGHACRVARRAISEIPDRKLRRIFIRGTMVEPLESITITGTMPESGGVQGKYLAQLLVE